MSNLLGSFGQASPRHKVFVSYHHANDQGYRDRFEKLFVYTHDIMVSKSVQIGNIVDGLPVEQVRQIIREKYLRQSTVTVVLIGQQTWQRKHVDWEISASIRDTPSSDRSGLLGIVLPSYQPPWGKLYSPHTIPPRLHDNIECGFAKIYPWSENPSEVAQWIHDAFKRRNEINPNNSYPNFVNNRTGERWQP